MKRDEISYRAKSFFTQKAKDLSRGLDMENVKKIEKVFAESGIKIETDWTYQPEPAFKEMVEIVYKDGNKQVVEACVEIDHERDIVIKYDDYVEDVCRYKDIMAIKITDNYIAFTIQKYGACPRESGDHCKTYLLLKMSAIQRIAKIVKKTLERKVYPMEPIEMREYTEVLYEAQ